MIGSLLGNRYEILSQLGGGGMALVYKARDTLLNRQVTVKILRPEFTGDEEFVARFRKEAQAVAKLSHPNIVSVYDVGQEGDTHYIVMEYVEGHNLKQIIKDTGKLPVKQAVDIAKQICDGLQDAHENGIVHRDIKPHNILVTDNGRVKVTDFGIAQMMSSVTITNSGTIVGSVHYFSPEQAKGGSTSSKSDIYSVGCVLYEMVTGKVPFEGDTPIAVALKHIQDDPIPPSMLNPQVSGELEHIILHAMEKDVSGRYAAAGDMAADLRRISGDDPYKKKRVIEADEFATRVLNGPVVITKGKEDSDMRKKKRKMKPMAKWLIVTAIIGLIAGAVYGLNAYLTVSEVVVPDLKNKSIEEAKAKLTAAKLSWDINTRYDPNIKAGYVISQDPPAEKRVKENTKVVLTVSQGPELATVPDVVRKELEAAQIEVNNAGFETSTSEEYSDDVPSGAIISQTPEGNTEAVKGSEVKLVVSKGAEPKYTTVPDIVGLSLEDARAKLQNAKLKLSSDITQEESTQYLSGTVMRQDPVAGSSQVTEGTEVKVVLSKGPGPQAKTAAVNVVIPNDGLTHNVKIVVIDDAGTRTAYEAQHNSGDAFTRVVTYYNKGKIQVFIDDFEQPVEERIVE